MTQIEQRKPWALGEPLTDDEAKQLHALALRRWHGGNALTIEQQTQLAKLAIVALRDLRLAQAQLETRQQESAEFASYRQELDEWRTGKRRYC